jgi:cell division transport system permease protein
MKKKLQQVLTNTKKLFRRSTKEGIQQLWRNKFLSFSTLGLGVLILFLLNFIFGIGHFLDLSLENLEKKADFSVPLIEKYDEFEFQSLQNELQKYPVEIQLLPAQSLSNSDEPWAKELTLPDRVHVKFQDLEVVREVLGIFKKSRYQNVVSDINVQGEQEFSVVIEKLLRVRNAVDDISYFLTMAFVLGGVLLSMNTFRMTLFARRKEVFIARLVGAKPIFIAGPFLFEGFLLGLISAIIAIIVFVIALKNISILPSGDIFLYLWQNIFAWELLMAGGVGLIGAWISVGRYIRGSFE